MKWKINHQLKAATSASRRQEIIDCLLKDRGLTTKAQIDKFFKPPLPQKITPKSVGLNPKHLQLVKKRLNQALKNQELIYIYGDYDADGVTATTILWETLHQLGHNVMPYIPSRDDPTRGLSQQGIDDIIDSALAKGQSASGGKPDLIITVDNGITSFKGCQYAKKLGIDIIITDHHQPQSKKPSCLAIIHSTQLAGAGVAWFLSYFLSPKAVSSLDVTALGTIADMVPLLQANRSLAKHGLVKLRQTRRPGLQALSKTAKLDLAKLQAWQVGYYLAPRLNAMARLSQALDSVRLLCTKDPHKARNLTKTLEQINQDRQTLTQDMLVHAQKQYQKQDQSKKLIFIQDKSYHEGIVGLVASRLVDQYHKPAIVVAIGQNYSKASARSITGFNAVKAFRQLSQHMLELGGHEMAAGFTAKTDKLPIIQKKLEALAETQFKSKTLESQIEIDCQIDLNDITWELYNQLQQFQPFGMDNQDPVFCTKSALLTSFRIVGQDQKHLKLKLGKFDAIAFNHGHLAKQLTSGQPLDIAYTLDENQWNGQKSLQLKIKSINSSTIL